MSDGMKRSEAAKIRIRKYPHTGLQNLWWASGLPHPKLGRPVSDEAKAKISQARTLTPSLRMGPRLCYLLGIIWGDGTTHCNSKNGSCYVRISCGLDEAMASECEKLLKQIGLSPRKYLYLNRSWQKPQWIVKAYSKQFVQWLSELTLDTLKSLQSEEAIAFWHGLFRAEGHMDRRGRLHISTVNKELMEWGVRLLSELGYHPKLYTFIHREHPAWKPLYRLSLLRHQEVSDFLSGVGKWR